MANVFSPNTMAQLGQLGQPQSIADLVALSAVGVVSAAYLLRGIAWDRPDPHEYIFYERMSPEGSAAGGGKATRNIAEKLEETGADVVIFWGSQSGTAEMLAGRLAKECHARFGLHALAADLSDYDADSIALIPQTKLAVFVVSTYGEGDPSDNATALWEWLQPPSPQNLPALSNLRYMALGLGNSTYRHYNRVVDVVTEALDKAGAQRLMPVGRADDHQGGTEEDFLAWKDALYALFTGELGYTERRVAYEPGIEVVEDPSLDVADLHLGEPADRRAGSRAARNSSPIQVLAVESARELYANSPGRRCVHLEVDIAAHPELRYRTGDHLAVHPMNPDAEVEALLGALGLAGAGRAETPLLVQPLRAGGDGASPSKIKIPSPTTPAALFRHYLEICAPVSREVVGALAQFAPTEAAAALLAGLGADRAAYAAYTARHHVTLGRLLGLAAPGAAWTGLPLSFVVESVPALQPRYYSISSSSVVSARRLAITVGVDNTALSEDAGTEIPGVASNYLLSLSTSLNGTATAPSPSSSYSLAGPDNALADGKLYASIRHSAFKLPAQSTTPLVMIAAGTGMAPFRGFVLERARLRAVGKPVGRMLLFFGCRRADEDFLYREELGAAAEALGGALEIVPAFSRPADSQQQKKAYVQDKLRDKKEEVCELLLGGANAYVCGRAAMAREAAKVVEEAIKEHKGWSDDEVRQWAESSKKGGKWLEDVWG